MTRKTCSRMLALVLSTLGSTAVGAADGTSNTVQFTYDAAAGCTARLAAGRGSTTASFTIDVGTSEGSAAPSTGLTDLPLARTRERMHLEDISLGIWEGPYESISLNVVTAPDRHNVLMISVGRENSIERVSMRPGIAAVLIGPRQTPVPALAFQDGDQIRLVAFDGADFRLVAQRPAPSAQAVEPLENTLVSGFRLSGVEIHTCTVLDGGE